MAQKTIERLVARASPISKSRERHLPLPAGDIREALDQMVCHGTHRDIFSFIVRPVKVVRLIFSNRIFN